MLAQLSDDALLGRLLGRPAEGRRLGTLLDLDEPALLNIGFSSVEAARVLTAGEIARRHQPRMDEALALTEPRRVVSLLADLRTASTARMVVLLLDRNLHLREAIDVSGNTAPCPLPSAGSVTAIACTRGATSMILVHNHVDGDATPTEADIEFTRQVLASNRQTGIDLADHVVVTRRGWLSLREVRLLG